LPELKDPSWEEIEACKYCQSYLQGEPFRAQAICTNPESPYSHFKTHKELTVGQKITGCGKIRYNGEKMPAHFFKWVPKESFLRTLPHEQVLEDSGREYLEPEHGLEQYRAFWEILVTF
jgi:hypothetical protein